MGKGEEDCLQSSREKLREIILLADVMGYGLEAIYREDDPTPASCMRHLKEELVCLDREYLQNIFQPSV